MDGITISTTAVLNLSQSTSSLNSLLSIGEPYQASAVNINCIYGFISVVLDFTLEYALKFEIKSVVWCWTVDQRALSQ